MRTTGPSRVATCFKKFEKLSSNDEFENWSVHMQHRYWGAEAKVIRLQAAFDAYQVKMTPKENAEEPSDVI